MGEQRIAGRALSTSRAVSGIHRTPEARETWIPALDARGRRALEAPDPIADAAPQRLA
jgi:hypothetical protein